jgi:ATP-dependent Clp protease adaptor protein ClpS
MSDGVATLVEPAIEEETLDESPWELVVWDDPVNTITYVIYVFRKMFGFSEEKATRLTFQVDREGRATVASGPREKMEVDCYRLHGYGLWATIEKA